MGFLLQENGCAPDCPAIFCVGNADGSGRGWAWHDDKRRAACFSFVGDVLASASLVSDAIQMNGIDGMLAVATLARELPGSVRRIFPTRCAACDRNHYERAAQIVRAVKVIHAGAIPSIRDACVPEYMLRVPYVCSAESIIIDRLLSAPGGKKNIPANAHNQKTVNRVARTRKNIPVWPNDPERTRLAQLAFARRYRLGKGAQE